MKEASLRAQISLGWVLALLISGIMLTFTIIESVLSDNDFRTLRSDPGIEGPKMMVFLVAFYALMPVYVNLVSGFRTRIFRWIAVVTAALGFLFFFLHHMSHWYFGTRPDFSSHVLDITVHLVGLWVLVNSIRWARLPHPVGDTEKTSAPGLAVPASR